MTTRDDDERRRYRPPISARHVRGVSCRNLRPKSTTTTTMTTRGRQQNSIVHGSTNVADADAATTSYGTYYTLRSARTRGAVYAPTPYGEVCVDDDGSTRVFQSETVRDGRALNPDWRWFDRGRDGARRPNDEGDEDDDDEGALVRALSGRGASRMTWRDGPAVEVDRTFKLELCVYGTQSAADVVGGFDEGGRAVGGTRWKRGEGIGTRTMMADGSNASDELICRAVVDLNRMVRLGDSIPSGGALPSNCIFVWLEDGVYAPEPVSTDMQGREIQGFIDEVLERNAREKVELNSVSKMVIDRVVMDDEEGSVKPASRRESASVSPISGVSMTASQQWSIAEKHVDVKRLELKPAVSRVEALIEANARHRDVRELRDELALRLEMQLKSLKGVDTIWGNRTTAQGAIDAREEQVKVDGLTLDEQMTMLTSELAEERESYSLMKADVARRVRGLRQAGEKLDQAITQLEESERQLDGPDGMGRLYQKQRALVARRWRLVGDLAKIFPISSVDGVGNGSQSNQKLQIGELALDLGPGPTELKSMRTEDLENDAAAYGHVAQICVQLAAILDVRLRYPVCPSLSRSYICDFQQIPVKPGRASERSDRRATRLARIEFPLFMDNLREGDRARYTYGVFLLNKNLAQLLNAHGENSVGPRHTLQNLKRIFDLRRNVVVARGSIEEAP